MCDKKQRGCVFIFHCMSRMRTRPLCFLELQSWLSRLADSANNLKLRCDPCLCPHDHHLVIPAKAGIQ
jgi:hypothetical protein